jgi:hypothetical protein
MWQLDNRTPFAAERAWVRGRDGAEIWIVAVKATFDIDADGRPVPSPVQPPVTVVPEHVDPDDAAQSSLRYDIDLVRTKVTTDVLLLGHAYAPGGRPATEVEVGLQVGPVVKRLRVVGDRVWQGGSMTRPAPFLRVPLVYERAYGGVDTRTRDTEAPQWDVRNPVGCGFSTTGPGTDGEAVPNVEYPDRPMRGWKDRPPPAGFGPVCAHWQPRVRLAGTYDEQWQQTRFPLLPEDFDDRHHQCAPEDQQAPAFLRGGELVSLRNLTSEGELRFALPRMYLGLETFFVTGERERHARPALHTVILEPDGPRVSLVWHSALPCHPKVYKLDRTRIIRKRVVRSATGEDVLVEEDA